MDDLLLQLARQYQNKYFGKYRGFVTDNDDPEQRGRVRLNVPAVLGEAESGWALPCLPFGGLADQGFFTVPEIGAQVWVEFEAGNLNAPIWTGTFWQSAGDPPAEAAQSPPTTRVFKTPAGHILQFDDKAGEEQFRLSHPSGTETTVDAVGTVVIADCQGNTLTLDADANKIVLEDANGNTLTMDASGIMVEDKNGNKVEMAAAGITVKGQQVVVEGQQVMLAGSGGEPIIKGQSFLTLFATHMHPHPMGPTGPPIPQGEMSTLSMKVMTS
ncbi:MAG: phage baseplate assembly protein V [Desulfobacca sp.]|nr:phage baseplate assembly protein V [Desulfobacca sp.]